MLVAIIALAAFVVVLALVLVLRSLSWRTLVRRQVIVVLDGERTISGVLYSQRGELLVLRNCTIYAGSTNGHPADGEVVIERSRVSWIQVVTS